MLPFFHNQPASKSRTVLPSSLLATDTRRASRSLPMRTIAGRLWPWERLFATKEKDVTGGGVAIATHTHTSTHPRAAQQLSIDSRPIKLGFGLDAPRWHQSRELRDRAKGDVMECLVGRGSGTARTQAAGPTGTRASNVKIAVRIVAPPRRWIVGKTHRTNPFFVTEDGVPFEPEPQPSHYYLPRDDVAFAKASTGPNCLAQVLGSKSVGAHL